MPIFVPEKNTLFRCMYVWKSLLSDGYLRERVLFLQWIDLRLRFISINQLTNNVSIINKQSMKW